MDKILTEHEEIMATQMWHAVMQSPQGRSLGRFFLREIGKNEKGNVGKVKHELLDLLSDVISNLYTGQKPEQSR